MVFTPSGPLPDFSGYAEHHYRTNTGILRLGWSSQKSPFQRWRLICFHSNTVFLTIRNSPWYSLHKHKMWKRSVEKYKSCGTLSNATHFLSVFCEACVVQQCTEAQAGVVQDGFRNQSLVLTPLTRMAIHSLNSVHTSYAEEMHHSSVGKQIACRQEWRLLCPPKV